MRDKITKVYAFEELSDKAKEHARDWYREGNFDYEWWDFVYEDAKHLGSLIGIDISKIYFSGFSCQGDGACFEGDYQYKKLGTKAIMSEAPKDNTLQRISKELQAIQRRNFYQITAHVKQQGHYYHEGCTNISVDTSDGFNVSIDDQDDIAELLRDFMRWIYRQLENAYDYMNEDEQVDEGIIANGYEFTEDGKIA